MALVPLEGYEGLRKSICPLETVAADKTSQRKKEEAKYLGPCMEPGYQDDCGLGIPEGHLQSQSSQGFPSDNSAGL